MRYLIVAILAVSLSSFGRGSSGQLMGVATTVAATAALTGASTNITFGKWLSTKCGPNPGCWALVGMAIYQSVEYFRTNDKNQETCEGIRCGGAAGAGGLTGSTTGSYTGGTTGGTTGGRSVVGPYPSIKYGSKNPLLDMKKNDPKLANVLNKMNDNGVSIDPENGTITTPRGTFTSDQLKTAEGLAAAGVTAQDLEEANKVAKEVQKDLQKQLAAGGMGEEGGGGGSRGGGLTDDLDSEDDMKKYLAAMMRKPASKESLAGLSVNYNGEPVGIAQGNLFETISLRYQKLQQAGVVGGLPNK